MAIYKLGDTAKIIDGFHGNPGEGEDNYFISSKDVGQYLNISRKVSNKKLSMRKDVGMKKGDILLTIVGTIGNIYYVDKDDDQLAFQNSVARIRTNNANILSKYVYLFLYKNISFLKKKVQGTSQKYFKIKDIQNFLINIPSVHEQQQIIDIIEPLEALETNMTNIKDELDSIIKELPEENKVSIGELCHLIRNKPKNIAQISAKALAKRDPIILSLENIGTYKSNSFFIPKNTLVINTIRVYLEKFGIAPVDCDGNGTLAHISVEKKYEASILSTLLNDDFWQELNKLSSGTKMPVVSKNDIIRSKAKQVCEIKGLFNLYTCIFNTMNEIRNIKEQLIKLLIK